MPKFGISLLLVVHQIESDMHRTKYADRCFLVFWVWCTRPVYQRTYYSSNKDLEHCTESDGAPDQLRKLYVSRQLKLGVADASESNSRNQSSIVEQMW